MMERDDTAHWYRFDSTRLVTFELDADEMMFIAAGWTEMENRTMYPGQSQGRYAVVPVDAL